MSVNIVQSLAEDEWRSFVDECPAGSIFHTPEMFRVFERGKGYEPVLWAAVNSSRILALLVPVQITIFNGPFKRLTTRAVVNGSVLCAQDTESRNALSVLLETYNRAMKATALITELRNLSNLEELQSIFREHGFAYEHHLNYLISLRCSPEKVFERFGRRTRKNIRRGLKLGKVSIEVVNERSQVAEFYQLLSRVYRIAKVPLADQSLFDAAFDLLHPKGMVRFTFARVDQVVVAVSMDLLYKGIVYGWYGGSNRDYGTFVPHELLMWDILKWGAENGYQFYDFGGAGKPDEEYGVRDFKAKFGGELVCFGRNTCVYSPKLFTLSKAGYAVLRTFL